MAWVCINTTPQACVHFCAPLEPANQIKLSLFLTCSMCKPSKGVTACGIQHVDSVLGRLHMSQDARMKQTQRVCMYMSTGCVVQTNICTHLVCCLCNQEGTAVVTSSGHLWSNPACACLEMHMTFAHEQNFTNAQHAKHTCWRPHGWRGPQMHPSCC